MPVPKGTRVGGRKKGTPNKRTLEVMQRLEEMDCDTIEGMVNLARGDAPCLCCKDGRVTIPQYYKLIRKQMPDPKDGESLVDEADKFTVCPNCGGTGFEPIEATLSGAMYKELAQYVAPKRKAVDITSDGDKLNTGVIQVPLQQTEEEAEKGYE